MGITASAQKVRVMSYNVKNGIGMDGVKNIERVLGILRDFGVHYVTLYAFSTENWKRPPEEINVIMSLLALYIDKCGKELMSRGVRMRVIGDKSALNPTLRKKIDKLVDFVKTYKAKGLAWARIGEDGTVASSFAKFMTEDEMKAILDRAGAEKGDVVFIIADTKNSSVLSS